MKPRLTYANVASTLALFAVVAGGTAIALPGKQAVKANDLSKNSVRAKAIAKNAVRANAIRKNAVGAKAIRENAVGATAIQDGAIGSAKVADGAITGADVAKESLTYGNLGSNSVVARIRSSGPVETGDGGEANPVAVPLTGNQWVQAGNETDVFFGEMTFAEPATCGNNGGLIVRFLVDGVLIDADFEDANPNETVTRPFLVSRPYLFEPGAAQNRTAAVLVYDDCAGAGEQYTLENVKGNAVAMR